MAHGYFKRETAMRMIVPPMAVCAPSRSKDTGLALYLCLFVTMLLVNPCLTAEKPAPWWTDSCNATPSYEMCFSSLSSPLGIRHGRSTNEVKILLDIFINTLRRNTRRINGFYTELLQDHSRPNFAIKNLNLEKIIKQMRLKRGHKLLRFYLGLQKIARVLDQTLGVKINSDIVFVDLQPRVCYLTEVLWALKALLCEVYDAIQEEVRNPEQRLQRHLVLGRGRRLNSMDLTDAFIRDITVLRKVDWFMKQSRKVLTHSNRRVQRFRHLPAPVDEESLPQ